LLTARLIGEVTRRLGQPYVIAEIMAGIALGPSLLGALSPTSMAALFPSTSLPALGLVSQLGLVLFMFLVGLELDPKLLEKNTRASVVIGCTSIAVPFAMGAATAWWLHPSYACRGASFGSFVLFMAAAMSVTAFPVLARILAGRQLLRSRIGVIAIACAAMNDVLAWCILAIVLAVVRGGGASRGLATVGWAAVFVFPMVFVFRPLSRRVFDRVRGRGGLGAGGMVAVLVLLLISSTISEAVGIHALVGAFLFGATLPKDEEVKKEMSDRLETVAVVLLLPLFFAYSGLRTDIGLLRHPQEWLVLGLLIVVATVGKLGGSAVAARITGFDWREAFAIGVLMNTRGMMELIVLNIGMDLGVLSRTVFTMLVIMALVTTVATTPVLRFVRRELCSEGLHEDQPAPRDARHDGKAVPAR
jgi:Kef-type K+ transport system membrane component KefB